MSRSPQAFTHTGIPIPARLAEAVAWAAVFDHVGSDEPGRAPFLEDGPEPAGTLPGDAALEPEEGGASTEPTGPVTSWAAVARVVGFSDDTLRRRRKRWGVKAKKPHFDSVEAARQWFRGCEHRGAGQEPRTPARRAPRRRRLKSKGTKGMTLADLQAEEKGGR